MHNTRNETKDKAMANAYQLTTTELRILNVIREHYAEGTGVLIAHDIRHLANNEVYLVYIVVAYESDASYIIHTETVLFRAGTYTLLMEHDLDLTEDVK